jgi:hypothetical protein
MSTQVQAQPAKLTAYESEQVRRIAAWKSEPPNPLSELWKRITRPGVKLIERTIPDRLVRSAIEKGYDITEILAGEEDIQRRAGVKDLGELRDKPLEECDRLAEQVALAAQALAVAEGAVTGAGGMLTTLLDVPLLFILALRTIIKTGHCYGYPFHHRKGRHFALGVLIAAISGSLEVRRQRISRLRELEDLLLEETQEEIIAEELLSFLFQLEIFEEVPGVGVISGAVLNVTFMHRVDVTARRVFQERWLRDNGKITVIEPAESHPRALAAGWSGALGRAAYAACYGVGFGVAVPVCMVGLLFRPMNNALTRGLRDGATAADQQAQRALGWMRGAPLAVTGRAGTPALASA